MTTPTPKPAVPSQVKRPRARRDSAAQVQRLLRKVPSLFPQIAEEGESLLTSITKAQKDSEAPSKQGVFRGAAPRPFDFRGAIELKRHNVHHSRCIEAKKVATVGLGHEDTTVRDKLDPLCRVSWLHTLLQIAEDFENTGNAFLEVVRDGNTITGLHFLPASTVHLMVEDLRHNYHYEVHSNGLTNRTTIKFAAFDDLEDFHARHPDQTLGEVSELIHFLNPTSYSRWWGQPDWLAAIACIELVQAITQHQFDFHINRGVPEFMLFVMGTKVKRKDWQAIEQSLQAQIGLANSHKSIAINLDDPNVRVQLEKMAMESAADGEYFSSMMETLSVNIVSAHGTPPAIAGIMIPGKMGASNEATNAIISFQSLTIGPRQEIFETILGVTLGGKSGVPGLSKEAFDFRTIVDEMAEAMEKLKPADTMGRMRDELPEAAAEGRDLEDGLQKQNWDARVAKYVLTKVLKMANEGATSGD